MVSHPKVDPQITHLPIFVGPNKEKHQVASHCPRLALMLGQVAKFWAAYIYIYIYIYTGWWFQPL